MRFPSLRLGPILLALQIVTIGLLPQDLTAQPEQEKAAEKETPADRYALPAGDADALLQFIEKIQKFRPAKVDEFLAHRKKAPEAIKNAAAKILELEQDRLTSDAAIAARAILLDIRVGELVRYPADQQQEVYEDVVGYLSDLKKLTTAQLGMAMRTASSLEQAGNKELATTAYQTLGQIFSESSEPNLVQYGHKMLGAARRQRLIGNEIKIEGRTIQGEAFDWESYRGKVVLVDFWATWCGPCIRELPNVKRNYEKYKERGFEVVGISLDTDRQRLENFIRERELPWVTLYESGAGWDHPIATHYGVMAIPMVVLVGSDGKVVSLNARGAELDRQLARLLGSETESAGGE